jgi:hypothetical protein
MLLHIWTVSGSNLGPETAQQEVTGDIPHSLQANAETAGSSLNWEAITVSFPAFYPRIIVQSVSST